MKLYVDDIRPAPEGWVQARTVTAAIKFIAQFGHEITDISLDHDISYGVVVAGTERPFPSPETFQAVAYYIERFYKRESDFEALPKITIHTANPLGGKELAAILACFDVTVKPESRVNRQETEI